MSQITFTQCTEDELLKLDEEILINKSTQYSHLESDLHILKDTLQLLDKQNQLFDNQLQTVQSNIQTANQNVSNSEQDLTNASTNQYLYFKRKFATGFLIGATTCLLLSPPLSLTGIIGTTVISGISGYLFT